MARKRAIKKDDLLEGIVGPFTAEEVASNAIDITNNTITWCSINTEWDLTPEDWAKANAIKEALNQYFNL